MPTARQGYAEDGRQITEDLRRSAEARCEHSQHLCEDAAMKREGARELRHMSQFARHRRKKQSARRSLDTESVV